MPRAHGESVALDQRLNSYDRQRSRIVSVEQANRALEIRFEAQRLTSHAGLVVFQRLFARLGLKERLRQCFRHLPQRAYPPHAIVLLLVVHLLGCRGLRDMARYRNDEAVRRAVGLRRLPDVSTVSRVLAGMDGRCVDKVRAANRELVVGRLRTLRPRRTTVDFDGSVLGTKRRAEGTAVGYNPARKGQRSYWPLFATVAQTSQALDVLHRPGNVADSTGAREFMDETLARLRGALPGTRLEARADGAFFGEDILDLFERRRVDYSVSVPFERFPALRQLIESQTRWRKAGRDVECFEPDWKPNSWARQRRIVVIRRRVPIRRPGPLQLDLFEPRAHRFEFKAVVTNKRQSARRVALFHDGRGAQEALFAELKSQCALSHVPARREPPTACSRLLPDQPADLRRREAARLADVRPHAAPVGAAQPVVVVGRQRPPHEGVGGRAILELVVHRLQSLDEGPNLLHGAQALRLKCHDHPPSVEDSAPVHTHIALDSSGG